MKNGRCRLHGGLTPSGPASPHWKHGRHSEYMKRNGLLARYDKASKDPEIISLRSELALVDTRVSQLLERIGEHGNVGLWKDARKKLDAFKAAAGKGKNAVAGARAALQQLDDLITQGLEDAHAWEELRESIELRRKVAETVHRIEQSAEYSVPVQEVFGAFRNVTALFLEIVKDKKQAAAFVEGLRGIIGQTQVIDVPSTSEN